MKNFVIILLICVIIILCTVLYYTERAKEQAITKLEEKVLELKYENIVKTKALEVVKDDLEFYAPDIATTVTIHAAREGIAEGNEQVYGIDGDTIRYAPDKDEINKVLFEAVFGK